MAWVLSLAVVLWLASGVVFALALSAAARREGKR